MEQCFEMFSQSIMALNQLKKFENLFLCKMYQTSSFKCFKTFIIQMILIYRHSKQHSISLEYFFRIFMCYVN